MARADYNIPNYDVDKVVVGQGEVFINPYQTPVAAGITPSTSMGAIDAVTLRTTSERVTLKQGTPLILLKQWNMEETAEFELDGWELNPLLLMNTLGAGSCTSDGTTDEFSWGGDWNTRAVNIMVQHQLSNGGCLFWDLWNCVGKGNLELTLNPTEKMKINHAFDVMRGAGTWVGGSLADRTRYYRIRVVNPP